MSWAKVDDLFFSHPKVVPTSLAARGLWITALSWVSAHRTDGFLPDTILPTLVREDPDALIEELVATKLWERDGPHLGWRIHDYLDWNPSRDELDTRRKALNARVAAFRERKRVTPTDGNAVGNALPSESVTLLPARPGPSCSEEDPTKSVAGGVGGKRKTPLRATTWPDDFTLTDERASWARDAGIEVAWEWNKFKDHALKDGVTHKNWNAAWRYWIRNAVDYAHRRRG